MDILLKNLKVIISAGGSGIGKAILERFHAQGAKIATCDINPDLVKTLKDDYPDIYAEVVDFQMSMQFSHSVRMRWRN